MTYLAIAVLAFSIPPTLVALIITGGNALMNSNSTRPHYALWFTAVYAFCVLPLCFGLLLGKAFFG